MSNVAIISIKPFYANQILRGTKTVELRRSPMGLMKGDIVLVYFLAPEQQLRMWFRVKDIETLPVAEMWRRYRDNVGIVHKDYLAYFGDSATATGIHVSEVNALEPGISLDELQQLVPGFTPPQGIIWLRDSVGRFERLLPRLSVPLPSLFLEGRVRPDEGWPDIARDIAKSSC